MEDPKIFIDKQGNWFQDGIKITHKWTYLANNRNLHMDKEGNFYIDEGWKKVHVEVEDTPFVVKMVDKKGDGFYALLNDQTVEKINFDNMWINSDNVPYTKVKNNKYKARFLRPAYYELAKYAVQDGNDFSIIINDKKIKIPQIV